MKTFKHVLYVIIDDVRNDHLYQLMSNGFLPTMQALSSNAIHLKHCITTFPSVTIPAHISLLTSQYPDSFNIPGIKYYRRDIQKFIKISDSLHGWLTLDEQIPPDVNTIYEMLPGEDTFVAYEGVTRGAKFVYSFRDATNLFKPASKIFKNHVENHQNTVPTLSVLWYYQPDPILHSYGAESRKYLRELVRVDRDLGYILKFLKSLDKMDDTLVVITSDHGNYTADEKLELGDQLQPQGLIRDRDYFVDFGSVGMFWFTTGSNPNEPVPLTELKEYGSKKRNLIDIISQIKGVERVFYLDEKTDVIHGFHGTKRGSIEWQDGKTKIGGEDIFGYDSDPLACQLSKDEFHDPKTWLKHTYGSELPLLPDQLARLFHNKNRPDLIACTDCKTVYNHLYSHDTYRQSVMNVPLILSGHGIPPMSIECARVVDIVPTILTFLGHKAPKKITGKPLLNDS